MLDASAALRDGLERLPEVQVEDVLPDVCFARLHEGIPRWNAVVVLTGLRVLELALHAAGRALEGRCRSRDDTIPTVRCPRSRPGDATTDLGVFSRSRVDGIRTPC